ncbi:MAG: riboflavin synthase [Chloroflexota bacterium]
MFTGIVEELGTVRALKTVGDSTSLSIASRIAREGLNLGDSVCVDGVCLTATALDPEGFTVGLSPETLSRTNLGERQTGDAVNLERSLAASGRFGGHYVQGHVDGVGRVAERREDGDSLRIWIRVPESLMRYAVVKGYISIDGVSLTITECAADLLGVALVAYTQEKISLPHKAIGASVNLEVDVVAKYVESLLEARGGTGGTG